MSCAWLQWSKEDKKIYKMCYDLHGVDKATYTMRKMFAKRKAAEDGVEEPAPKKPAPKKEPEPVKLINDSKPRSNRPCGKLLVSRSSPSAHRYPEPSPAEGHESLGRRLRGL